MLEVKVNRGSDHLITEFKCSPQHRLEFKKNAGASNTRFKAQCLVNTILAQFQALPQIALFADIQLMGQPGAFHLSGEIQVFNEVEQFVINEWVKEIETYCTQIILDCSIGYYEIEFSFSREEKE